MQFFFICLNLQLLNFADHIVEGVADDLVFGVCLFILEANGKIALAQVAHRGDDFVRRLQHGLQRAVQRQQHQKHREDGEEDENQMQCRQAADDARRRHERDGGERRGAQLS